MLAGAPPVDARDLRVAARHRRWSPAATGVVAGLATFALYAATGSRGVEWQDPGIHQYRILTGLVESPVGLALSHPLHHWLGRLVLQVPLGDPIHRLNLLSGLCGAAAVGALAGLLVRLTRSPLAAGFAAAALALTHSFWQMSTFTETYTLAAMLMTIEWALLLGYVRTQRPIWLVAVLAVNGLHVADHLLGLLTLATYVVLLLVLLVRGRIGLGWLLAAAGAWLLTASPYGALIVAHWQRSGDLGETLGSAFFGGNAQKMGWRGDVLNTHLSWAQTKLAVLTFGYCFPSLTGLLAAVGLFRRVRGRRRVFRWVLLGQTVLICAFVGRYPIKDLYTYFVPVCAVTALWFGWGLAALLRRWRSGTGRRWLVLLLTVNALLPLPVYYYFPIIAERHGWLRGQLRHIPFRNEYRHFFQPWRIGEHSAATFATNALEQIGPGGWLLADNTTACPVAVTALLYGGPPGARVYWFRDCATAPGTPPLTDADLLAHVRNGGRVLAMPLGSVAQLIKPPLTIDKSAPLWQIVYTPPDSSPAAAP
jgi:hypothetical protein